MKSLEEYAQMVNQALEALFPPLESSLQTKVKEAARYSLLLGGKRIRSSLLLATADFMRLSLQEAMGAACALEMVHTYSLIHDDLPCMDNDDLRRGKPSNHKVYGEAMAILAGDGLLTDAFTVLSQNALLYPAHAAYHLQAIYHLASLAGMQGMIAGQAADVQAENEQAPDSALLKYIEQHKTADLLTAPLLMGLDLGGASEETKACFLEYGKHLGIAFQIADDLLDLHATPEELGKSTGKDQVQNKLTYPSLFGETHAYEALNEETMLACQALSSLSDKKELAFFIDLAQSLRTRTY